MLHTAEPEKNLNRYVDIVLVSSRNSFRRQVAIIDKKHSSRHPGVVVAQHKKELRPDAECQYGFDSGDQARQHIERRQEAFSPAHTEHTRGFCLENNSVPEIFIAQ